MDDETLALLKEISAKLDILLERTEPKKRRPSPGFAMSVGYSPRIADVGIIDMATSTLDADDYKRAFVTDAMDQRNE